MSQKKFKRENIPRHVLKEDSVKTSELNAIKIEAMSNSIPLFESPAYELRGVRGWLLFFWIGCLLSFLTALGNALDLRHWPQIYWTFVAALEVTCCISLWLKSPRGLNILYLLFGVTSINLAHLLVEGIRAIVSSQVNVAIMHFFSCVVGSLLLFAWYRYFKDSVRVRNTYGRNL